MEKKNDNFIMLPTVDICFKNLMENPEVRRGFIAALLKVQPEEIEESTLLPTTLQRDYGDDKLGILDILVQLEDGTQIDMEMQVLELKKLPGKVKGEEDIISWMRFLGGKTREEFEDMADLNKYIGIAYEELQKLSADELKRLDYESREKAIRDHKSFMRGAIKQGLKQGLEQGLKEGQAIGERSKLREITKKKMNRGMTAEEIADDLEEDVETIRSLYEEILKEKTDDPQ